MKITKAMTTRTIDAIAADTVRREYRDPGCRGLYLVVQPSGAKSWAWRAPAIGGQGSVKKTLGTYPAHSLADAHEWAAAQTKARESGIDLDQVKRAADEAAAEAAQQQAAEESRTLDWYWTIYEPEFVQPLRDKRETTRMWEKLIRPVIGHKVMATLTHNDIAHMLDGIRSHAPVSANRVRTMLRTMWTRAMSNHLHHTDLATNPTANLARPVKRPPRKRFLSEVEIGYLLRVLASHTGDDYVSVYASALRMMLSTATRLRETTDAVWSEFSADCSVWSITEDRIKNHDALTLPLATQVVARLQSMKARTNSKFVFYSRRDPTVALSGYSKPQAVIVAEMQALALKDGVVVEHWTPHDFRRTFRTHLGEMVTPDHTPVVAAEWIEACLNHRQGSGKSGIQGVYNLADYKKAKGKTLQVWADWLDAIAARSPAP